MNRDSDLVPYPTDIKELYRSWIPHKEHYCVFPGRTTIIETGGTRYRYQANGDHGTVTLTTILAQPTPSQRTDR
jgi:hypothetical protein